MSSFSQCHDILLKQSKYKSDKYHSDGFVFCEICHILNNFTKSSSGHLLDNLMYKISNLNAESMYAVWFLVR